MPDFAKEILPVSLEEEMRKSYLDYAMSVIIGRALPDIYDGLKPVHRRVLYAMSELHNDFNKPYKKSARIVGDVIGKYHPHGDSAVYDTLVRMAQTFSLRYPLIDGQGNFGSIDGDAPAAMRYTEVRLSKIAHELLADIDKETVDFIPNYDNSEKEPVVLPSRIPNLLVNGSAGIAVGMATSMPTHNLGEVIDAVLAVAKNPDISIADLMRYIPGPDFPTAAIINGRQGIYDAYRSGRGRVVLRASCRIESVNKGEQELIIVEELPYMVNKAHLLEKIADLVKEKRIEGITELRDETDKEGMRIVIELKRRENSQIILNNLYKYTKMQTTFSINMVALQEGQPKLFNLKEILEAFLRHRRNVVTRRTVYELRKAKEKAHTLEGLSVALANIDEVIALIKKSQTSADAKSALMEHAWKPGAVVQLLEKSDALISKPDTLGAEFGLHSDGYHLSAQQAQAILDLKLHRLTALEQDKIVSDYEQLIALISELLKILSDPDRLIKVICDELKEIKKHYGDPRRTKIVDQSVDMDDEDLIPQEDMILTISHAGYAKIQPPDHYRAQHRGGRGKTATSVREEDFIEMMFMANSHDTLLCFSNLGQLYWLKVYKLPRAGRTARGKPMVNMLNLGEGERITAILPVKSYADGLYVTMATAKGIIKRTSLNAFSRPRSNGIKAINLQPDDKMIGAVITDGTNDIMLFNNLGRAIRFKESDVRTVGRTAKGVIGMRLRDNAKIISLICLSERDKEQIKILIATENGYGKRTQAKKFTAKRRGGLGMISIKTNKRNGTVIGALPFSDDDEVMLITDQGVLVRTRVSTISAVGRNTQGVRLIRLDAKRKLSEIVRIEKNAED
ncbi:MAG: DNA gyrase subunit A [Chromatiales bacterium]|nr:DNA gyrase subunit A [Chromatiales bacterium]